MFEIKFDVKDLRNMRKMPKEFREGTLKGMRKAMFVAEDLAKGTFTKSRGKHGGLHVRSGDLQRRIKSGVAETNNTVVGWLANNMAYAAVHEYGFKGSVTVKAHIRQRGKTVFTVRSHTRQMNIPMRKFLKPGITENMDRIRDIIRESIVKEVSK
jgi:phage gpG-like protein